jgi:hypothetical protein
MKSWVGILVGLVVAAAIIGMALRTTIDEPASATVHHDDFTFRVIGASRGATHDRLTPLTVRIGIDNDAKLVGYDWESRTAYLVDAAGVRYNADARLSSPAQKIAAGGRAEVRDVFSVPAGTRGLSVAFWDGVLMGDVFDGVRYARLRVRLAE